VPTTNEIVKIYTKIHSIRAVSRQTHISRTKIRKILIETGIRIPDSRTAQLAVGYIQEKKKFCLSPQEKAYLYGLVMGDLTPILKSKYTLKLITTSTHKTFMEMLCKTFKKYGITNHKETKNKNTFRFQSHIDLESFLFLLDTKNKCMPTWIKAHNFYNFLGGFIDSDGSIIVRKSGNYFQYVIRFFSQNLDLLLEIKSKLKSIGYHLSIHKSHSKGHISYHKNVKFQYNRNYYTLETYKKEETLDLLGKIPIRHPEKIAKKNLIFDIYRRKLVLWKDIENQVKELREKIRQSVIQRKALSSPIC